MWRRLVGDERGVIGRERVGAWLLVLVAIGLVAAVVVGPGVAVATNAPEASFEGTYDADANALTVAHAGGDSIRAGTTESLVLVVADGDGGHGQNVTWVAAGGDGVASFPVQSGDEIVVDDAAVDADGDGNRFDGDITVGFTLDEGDEVAVVWRGRPLGAPEPISRTLGTVPVGGPA